jgi:hypothetical protein
MASGEVGSSLPGFPVEADAHAKVGLGDLLHGVLPNHSDYEYLLAVGRGSHRVANVLLFCCDGAQQAIGCRLARLVWLRRKQAPTLGVPFVNRDMLATDLPDLLARAQLDR